MIILQGLQASAGREISGNRGRRLPDLTVVGWASGSRWAGNEGAAIRSCDSNPQFPRRRTWVAQKSVTSLDLKHFPS